MTAQKQDHRSAAAMDAAWVAILAALVAVLAFLLGLAGVPETRGEIVLADAIFVALVSILLYKIESYQASKGQKTLFRGRPVLALIVAAVALGGIGGTLTELASSADDPAVRPAIAVYEKQVRQVFNPLRATNAAVFEAPASLDDPALYAKNAKELSEAYRLAGNVLEKIEPPRRGDQALHSLLGARLASVGEAYARLGSLVAQGASESTITAAEKKVEDAGESLLGVQETLGRRGYRISLGV